MLSAFGYREYDFIWDGEVAEMDVDHALRPREKR